MIEIHTTNYHTPIHCIICGTQTTDAEGSVVSCSHLVFLGMVESVEFSIYDNVDKDDEEGYECQYDAQLNEFRKELDDEHLCIHVVIPAPSGATYSIIYNLNANIQDTKNQQNSDGVDWRETGE